MQVERSIEITRPIEQVFAFVADARNDPQWCPKVISTLQSFGDGPGPGARYAVVHRPIPMRPARNMIMECVSWSPPFGLEWHENDGIDELQVAYLLSDHGGTTGFTQRSFLKQAMPQRLRPVMRHGLGGDLEHQLTALKKLLESSSDRA